MPYITREDGERFVIPSYRDILSAKNNSVLKKDIILLSQNYGEYITLQRKNPSQYEVAFSPDTGYLLGETVWHHFHRPTDMIYCEAIPNTTEAILVIVKAGSVYLDGSFPLDSIPEELVIFLTQRNNFEIYIYGDVPISEKSEEGKFNFEPSSVRSFTVLEQPVFPTLPLLKIYQLQLVDIVLKEHGIGVFPLRQIILTMVVLGLIYMIYSYLTTQEQIQPILVSTPPNPYQAFYAALSTSAPAEEIDTFLGRLSLLYTLPGWYPVSIDYSKGIFTALIKSSGGSVEGLKGWVATNNFKIDIRQDGIYIITNITLPNRPIPTHIFSVKEIVGRFIDNLAAVYPGNHLEVSKTSPVGAASNMILKISFDSVSPLVLRLVGQQLKDLPFVLQDISLTVDVDSLSGTMTIEALGN